MARADKLKDKAGLYLVEPYQPGKIPVVLVHGLLSSPLTWAPLFNDLMADPKLRQRYQFWRSGRKGIHKSCQRRLLLTRSAAVTRPLDSPS